MREVDSEDLLRMAVEDHAEWVSGPHVDGWVLEEAPARVFEAGLQTPVPLLSGFNRDEWTSLGHSWPDTTLAGLRDALRSSFGELAVRAIELYPASTDEEAAAIVDQWQTDSNFACPSRFIADRVAGASTDVFFYLFSRAAPAPGSERLGAYHGAETAYVMDNLALEPWVPRDDVDQRLADVMSGYWVQFAASGDPNGGGSPIWPRYTSESPEFLEFGDSVETGTGIRSDYCDLYDELQQIRLEAGE